MNCHFRKKNGGEADTAPTTSDLENSCYRWQEMKRSITMFATTTVLSLQTQATHQLIIHWPAGAISHFLHSSQISCIHNPPHRCCQLLFLSYVHIKSFDAAACIMQVSEQYISTWHQRHSRSTPHWQQHIEKTNSSWLPQGGTLEAHEWSLTNFKISLLTVAILGYWGRLLVLD